MSSNNQFKCRDCRENIKVFKSGLGLYHLSCACGHSDGMEADQAACQLETDCQTLKRVSKDLMTTDVCV